MLNALKKSVLIAGLLLVASLAHASSVAYSGPFIGTEGTAVVKGGAVAQTFTRDMNATGDRVSMQISYSSYTVAVSTNFGSNNFVLNTPTITISGNNFTTGQQVLYSTAAATAIAGLVDLTTYYISVIGPNTLGVSSTIKLSTTLAFAQSGVGVVLASSSTSTNRYTLAPLAFTNVSLAGGIQIQWSDDKNTFFNATVGNYNAAITSTTYVIGGGSALYDLGPTNHRYLRLKVTPPDTGAVTFTATDNERYSFEH